MQKLIWLIDPTTSFEQDWIRYLIGPIDEVVVTPESPEADALFENACIVFNASVPEYEEYFQRYDEERIPFGVIHLSDETLGNSCDFLQLPMCKFAFRNYHHPLHSRHPKVTTFGLGCKAGFANGMCQTSDTKWFHWCFAGAMHNPKRLEAAMAFREVIPYVFVPGGASFNGGDGLSLEKYRDMLARQSKFALCPIGQGNLDTFRFYEALEAGCVPIVLSETKDQPYTSWGYPSYWHAMFPEETEEFPWVMGKTWEECVDKVKTILQHPEVYRAMVMRLQSFWEWWKKEWSTRLRERMCDL